MCRHDGLHSHWPSRGSTFPGESTTDVTTSNQLCANALCYTHVHATPSLLGRAERTCSLFVYGLILITPPSHSHPTHVHTGCIRGGDIAWCWESTHYLGREKLCHCSTNTGTSQSSLYLLYLLERRLVVAQYVIFHLWPRILCLQDVETMLTAAGV